ncbi:MAG: pantetheine-phosphate adenylyltransferase [Bacteroidaceae bacterium]|nr:pantetheine-phosphate adenylyltransferase [Bacteroidaceae bacterium]
MRTAIFPGTFDPFTKGHADIVARGLEIFDRIVIAVGVNEHKQPDEGTDTRLATIDSLYADDDRVGVCAYMGLTIDFAREQGAQFILRGVRSLKDYEYERDIADINCRLSGIETVLLFSRPQLAAISSSLVRELQHMGRDVSEFLP